MENENPQVEVTVSAPSETVEENAVTLAEEAIALAEVQAARTVAEVHEEIADVNNELQRHEESDQWMKTRLEELSLMMSQQQSELLTLRASVDALAALQVAEVVNQEVAATETPPAEVEAIVTPESDLTKTEAQVSDVAESPAVEPEPPARKRKIRLI